MEVGDYVKIKDGTYNCIGKIKRFEQTNCLHIIIDYSNDEDFNESDWFEWNIIKSSPNIIDLIEVGDYVNGEKVTKVVLDSIECNYIELDYSYNKHSIRNKDIKSIVTKEQFESIQYIVKDKEDETINII